jgi:hypothetical protein
MTMRTEEEVRRRRAVNRELLADTYGKEMPFAEERLAARVDEDDWFLNDKDRDPVAKFFSKPVGFIGPGLMDDKEG